MRYGTHWTNVGWLTFYEQHGTGPWYGPEYLSRRQVDHRARAKHLKDSELMAELHRAVAEYCHAILTGVGVDKAAKWLEFLDRIVALEEQQ